jgi:ABC-2 type transport system ATP-binding protein
MDLAIHTTDLRKEYGTKVAVRRLSLTVPRGSIFGFLGPNGAGKSTSIKMLLGLVRPTSGEARVLGAPAGDVQIRRRIGFLPEDFRFYEWLTAAELVTLHGRLAGVSRVALRERVPLMLDLVGLTPHRDKRLQYFSKGMLQRVGLAQALVHQPDILFLDEPTSGLDPMGRRLVRDVIRAQRDLGTTVFLNSHLLGEIEVTCDHVAFIKDGEIVATHDLRSLLEQNVQVRVKAKRLPPDTAAQLARWTTSATIEEDLLTFSTHSTDVLPDVVRTLVAAGADIYQVTPEQRSLEEIFVGIMGEDRGL